ncbi:tail fiber domain-containing protein [Chromobacterium haemolyticum]|uniref:tail fiber domain-containing protein n=1 Tax=Chromobacterium haemolyticum TaxID=394935 RepID=UPI000DEFBDD9|nr:tail fiber domain-containing protein [Chromobacterium haemolyticum]
MQNTLKPIHSPDGLFHDGNPTTGELGTIVSADWLNSLQQATAATQDELITLIKDSGQAVDAGRKDQLLQAVKQLAWGGNSKPTTLAGYGILDAASKKELKEAIDKIINGAPGALDTLQELAAALGNDKDFATNVTNQLASKASIASLDQVNQRMSDAGDVGLALGSAAKAVEELKSSVVDLNRNQTIVGTKVFKSPAVFELAGGSWIDWNNKREASVQVNCPENNEAYMVWRSTKQGGRHLAAMDVHAANSDTIAPVVSMHVGKTGSHTWNGDNYTAAGNISAGGQIVPGPINSSSASGDSSSSIEIRNLVGASGDAGMAAIAFHCQGSFATKLGLRADGFFGLGGWSAAAWRWYVNANTGDMYSAGNVTWFSDRRLKKDIARIEHPLEKIRQLNGYLFTRIDSGLRQTGLIAQEVQAVMPEAVLVAADEERTLTVAYGNLVGLLVEALKEQDAKQTEQTQQISWLQQRVAKLEQER